jgi:hypothetical protein
MKKIIRLTESDLTRIVRRVIRENDDDDFSEHEWKYQEMNKNGIKRIDQLRKLVETGEDPSMTDLFQYELDLVTKSNERLRGTLNSFDERHKR